MRLLEQPIPQGDIVEDNIVYKDENTILSVRNGYVFLGEDGAIYIRANNDCKIVGGELETEVPRGEYRLEVA